VNSLWRSQLAVDHFRVVLWLTKVESPAFVVRYLTRIWRVWIENVDSRGSDYHFDEREVSFPVSDECVPVECVGLHGSSLGAPILPDS
jgi:hypothetical protein